ncbi:MAG: purine-nucleoside phosphorylase, partial [Candidatus Cloacimonetes bacterium]|nr:purine-nucleoside phosphorylase [Candidatus Cloacimonadota bacterium]
MLNDITTACEYISSHFCSKPETALILGTGLNSLAEKLTSVVRIPYQEIPGFSPVTAPEHKGMLITGKFSGQDLLIMQGRYHYYEGYSGEQLIFPVRVLKQMGIRNLIVTNAAGSLNQNLHPGMLVIIKDHINLMGTNPLIGLHDESLGERFPSMNEAYNRKMISQLKDIAQQENIEIREGIYAAVSGPSLETKAECLMLQRLGA